MQQSIVKFYFFVVKTLLDMFRSLFCPPSGARQTARQNARNMLSSVCTTKKNKILRSIVAFSWVFE
jgi:hypothetical protein